MANSNDKTAFQIGADAVSKIVHPRRHSQAVNEAIVTGRNFLDEFKAMVSRAYALADVDSQKALEGLMDDIKYSDPVSVAEAAYDEEELLSIAEQLITAIDDGSGIQEELVTRLRSLLRVRNNTCKSAK